MNFSAIISFVEERINEKAVKGKIDQLEGRVFAKNEKAWAFAELVTVAEYRFLSIRLVGPLKVQTFKGCKLVFEGNSQHIELDSDTVEIKTDFSKKLGVGITDFDIDLEIGLEDLFRQKTFTTMRVVIEKETFVFEITHPEAIVKVLEEQQTTDEPEDLDLGQETQSPIGPMY